MLQLIQRASAKGNISSNFKWSGKETVLLLLSWSTLYAAFLKCILSWFWLFFFYLSTFTQNLCIKGIYSRNFRCTAKEAVLLLRSGSTLDIAFSKCKVSWFYFYYFNLSLLTESAYAKVIFSWNFSCSTKEAVLLLLSWRNLYVAISKCMVSWF